MAKQPDRSPALSFLYRTAAGRFLLKGLTAPPVSRLAGRYLDSHLSRIHIAGFVRRYGMDLTGCEKQSFSSFNDFFTRRLRPDQRPIDLDPAAFISPCDGQLSVFHLNSSRMFQIKGSRYSLPDLLGGQENATRYANGLCLVFRLCVDDYHRYCYIDWGVKGENHFLPGILHTVRPIALASCPVFIQNSREYTWRRSISAPSPRWRWAPCWWAAFKTTTAPVPSKRARKRACSFLAALPFSCSWNPIG